MKFSELVRRLADSEGIVSDRGATCSLDTMPDLDPDLVGASPIDETAPNTLSYVEGKLFAKYIENTTATALVVPCNAEIQAQASDRGIAWIASQHPRATFARAIAIFYQPFRPAPGIHPTAIIAADACIGENVHIGAYVTIQSGVTIGDGVCIHPHVAIYPDVTIGDRSTLHTHCTIHERTYIGKDCVIHSSAVIGSEGFGFVPTPQGWLKMEQSGRTVLGDSVEVGCNSSIDRPAVGETRIGNYTKIDNLVQIAHGCVIGSNCALAGQVGLAGGVKVGNNVLLAGQVGIANRAVVGDGAIATAKTGILKNVPPKATVSGYPAVPHAIWLRTSSLLARFPEIYRWIQHMKHHLRSQTNIQDSPTDIQE